MAARYEAHQRTARWRAAKRVAARATGVDHAVVVRAQRLGAACCCASFGLGLSLSAVPLHAPASLDAQAGSRRRARAQLLLALMLQISRFVALPAIGGTQRRSSCSCCPQRGSMRPCRSVPWRAAVRVRALLQLALLVHIARHALRHAALRWQPWRSALPLHVALLLSALAPPGAAGSSSLLCSRSHTLQLGQNSRFIQLMDRAQFGSNSQFGLANITNGCRLRAGARTVTVRVAGRAPPPAMPLCELLPHALALLGVGLGLAALAALPCVRARIVAAAAPVSRSAAP